VNRRRRRRWRRRAPGRLLGEFVLGFVAVAALGWFGASLFLASDDGAGASSAAAPAVPHKVQRLPPALAPVEQQGAVGPLPEPAGAAHVDLTQPSLMSYLRLRPRPKAGLAFDLADGTVLWRLHATSVRPIASLTKLMTALLAVERFGARQRVRISRESDWVGGSRMGGLKPGRRVRADVLLKGLLISSANNAAVALASAGAGSERAWVALMNKRAKLLGLTCTHFVDAHGLDVRNRSCAADLATLAMRAMNEPRIAEIARKRYARVWPGAGKKLTLRTTNHLLRDKYPGAIGLKTGFTNPAGFCLVAIVKRGGRRIGIVVLGSKDSFGDARRVTREAARMGVLPAS
jgi:D-alanyl-D-alanine carboxypeptidase (penicillin-binding protein 5/6)